MNVAVLVAILWAHWPADVTTAAEAPVLAARATAYARRTVRIAGGPAVLA